MSNAFATRMVKLARLIADGDLDPMAINWRHIAREANGFGDEPSGAKPIRGAETIVDRHWLLSTGDREDPRVHATDRPKRAYVRRASTDGTSTTTERRKGGPRPRPKLVTPEIIRTWMEDHELRGSKEGAERVNSEMLRLTGVRGRFTGAQFGTWLSGSRFVPGKAEVVFLTSDDEADEADERDEAPEEPEPDTFQAEAGDLRYEAEPE